VAGKYLEMAFGCRLSGSRRRSLNGSGRERYVTVSDVFGKYAIKLPIDP